MLSIVSRSELIGIYFCSVIAALGPDTITTRTATEPNGPTGVLFEDEDVDANATQKTIQTEKSTTTPADKSTSAQKPYRLQIRWRNVFLLGYLHLAALYGLYLTVTSAKLLTTIFGKFLSRSIFYFLCNWFLYYFVQPSCFTKLEDWESLLALTGFGPTVATKPSGHSKSSSLSSTLWLSRYAPKK